MPDFRFIFLVRSLRERAQKILAQAEAMGESEAEEMRKIAFRYEKLAQRMEEQADDADKA
jgi:hypothetical protein